MSRDTKVTLSMCPVCRDKGECSGWMRHLFERQRDYAIMADLSTHQCAGCTVVCIWCYEGFALAHKSPATGSQLHPWLGVSLEWNIAMHRLPYETHDKFCALKSWNVSTAHHNTFSPKNGPTQDVLSLGCVSLLPTIHEQLVFMTLGPGTSRAQSLSVGWGTGLWVII